jgi:hypothetical protein
VVSFLLAFPPIYAFLVSPIRAMKELGKLKNPMTSGIEPTTFQLVA